MRCLLGSVADHSHFCFPKTVSFNGVAFFQAQDLTAEDLANLALQLGEAAGKPADSTLHIHPTAPDQLGENGLPIGKISSEADASGRQISFKDERSNFASAGWHTGACERAHVISEVTKLTLLARPRRHLVRGSPIKLLAVAHGECCGAITSL